MNKQRVRLELANGGGVVLEAVCALCEEGSDGIVCPICNRMFCAELCFGVHLNARDVLDAPDTVRAFLRTPVAHEMLAIAFDGAVKNGKPVDWRHGLTCEDCNVELRDIVVQLLCETARGLDEEAEAT